MAKDNLRDDTLDNIILVIGNGFDIGNGYKTRYSDFLDFTKKIYEKDKFDNTNEQKYKEIIKDNNFIKHFINY